MLGGDEDMGDRRSWRRGGDRRGREIDHTFCELLQIAQDMSSHFTLLEVWTTQPNPSSQSDGGMVMY